MDGLWQVYKPHGILTKTFFWYFFEEKAHALIIFSKRILSPNVSKRGGVGALKFNPNEETKAHRGERTIPESLRICEADLRLAPRNTVSQAPLTYH